MHTAATRFLLVSLIISILGALLFTSGLPGEFVFDDLPNIVNNDAIRLTQLNVDALVKTAFAPQLAGNMRVLPTLTFALDFWRTGEMDPTAFKMTNIAIHALTTFLLAWLFRSLLLISGTHAKRVNWLAPTLALAWAIHPLQVSAVLYVVQRMQTMGTLFLVPALWAYLLARQAQIEGRSGRTGFMVAVLLWLLAMGCKEDTVLLPAYTLALELTVLRFAALNAGTSQLLRRGYLVATLMGAAAYFLWVLPHYWHWDAYTGREFSTPERLLTQPRILCLYLWQIVLPLPSHMPFFYDGLELSRGLLHPWTTLPAFIFLLMLLTAAWRLRTTKPLFSLGVFLFFSAHFVTSNVVGLELAFEHRNHFALIGALLAACSVLATMGSRLEIRPATQIAVCAAILVGMGSATVLRAHTWRNNFAHAISSTTLAPNSARAWYFLCTNYLESGGGLTKENPHLRDAINACSEGAASAPYALRNLTLLIALKTLNGDITRKDWERLQEQLKSSSMNTFDNRRAPMILAYATRKGVKLDRPPLLEALDTLAQRDHLAPIEVATIGYFMLNDLAEPDRAYPHFVQAITDGNPDDPFPNQLEADLRSKGRPDLADGIKQTALARGRKAPEILRANREN